MTPATASYARTLLATLDRDEALTPRDKRDNRRMLRETRGRLDRAIRDGHEAQAAILARHLTTYAFAIRPDLRLAMALEAEGRHPHDAATHPGVL